MITHIPLDQINEETLRDLIVNGVPEGRHLDYKREPHKDMKDLVTDTCAMANSGGGDLLIGMDATDGIASELVGIDRTLIDKFKLQASSAIRDGLAPTLIGVELREVSLSGDQSALIIRIPVSLNAPHQIIRQGLMRFYARGSAGNQIMTVEELRRAFTAPLAVAKEFEIQRRRDIDVAAARSLIENFQPFLVYHVTPALALYDPCPRLDLHQIRHALRGVPRTFSGSEDTSVRYVLEGLERSAVFRRPSGHTVKAEYVQVHREGRVVGAAQPWWRNESAVQPFPWSPHNDFQLMCSVADSVHFLAEQGLSGPYFVSMSLRRCHHILPDPQADFSFPPVPFGRQVVDLPGIQLEGVGAIEENMKHIFDQLWNAGGIPWSPSYQKGVWRHATPWS